MFTGNIHEVVCDNHVGGARGRYHKQPRVFPCIPQFACGITSSSSDWFLPDCIPVVQESNVYTYSLVQISYS